MARLVNRGGAHGPRPTKGQKVVRSYCRAGCPHPAAVCRTISYISEQERQRKEKLKTMLHLDEVFSAEIYAKDALFAGEVKRVEGSLETMGFKWRFLWYFLFADEKKVPTFPP